MTIKEFTRWFEGKYPLKLQEKWDNCGLLFGSQKQVIKNIVVALDLTTEVMNEAIKNKVDLIITHHPFMWPDNKEEQFKEAPYKESIYRRLDNTGIALYAAHTNFDVASDGMSDTFIEMLGFKPRKISGATFGKMFEVDITFMKLKKLLTEKIGITRFVTNADPNALHTKVAVLPGSGMTSDIIAAHKAGAGLIVTADVKWAQWVSIKELDINVVQVTHGMEDVFTHKVSDYVSKKFKDVVVFPIYTEEIAK